MRFRRSTFLGYAVFAALVSSGCGSEGTSDAMEPSTGDAGLGNLPSQADDAEDPDDTPSPDDPSDPANPDAEPADDAPDDADDDTDEPATPDPDSPDSPVDDDPASNAAETREFTRLTRAEYLSTVLLAFDVEADAATIPVDGRVGPFTSNVEVTPDPVHPYLLLAEDLASQLVPGRLPACTAETAADCIAENYAAPFERLYRRPVLDSDLAAWSTLMFEVLEAGGSEEDATRAMIASALTSPDFLFRAGPSNAEGAAARRLAERLGYALWDAPPDAELLTAALGGTLQSEISRVVSDERAIDVVTRFVAQWLDVDTDLRLENADFAMSPAYLEWRAFISEVLENDVAVAELISGEWGFVHRDNLDAYELDALDGEDDVARVNWPSDSNRRGALAQDLFAASTRHPDASRRPIFRGLLVRRSLLCQEIPPPSPELVNLAGEVGDRTVDARCATCHQLLDPVGVAFASLDPDNDAPAVEAQLLGAGELEGSYADLAALLEAVAQSRAFAECFSRHWLSFLLEQPLSQVDEVWTAQLADSVQAGQSLSQIVEQSVTELEARSLALEPWCAGE